MQLVQDVVVDDALQSLVSMHHPMNTLNIKTVVHTGQFVFYLADVIAGLCFAVLLILCLFSVADAQPALLAAPDFLYLYY